MVGKRGYFRKGSGNFEICGYGYHCTEWLSSVKICAGGDDGSLCADVQGGLDLRAIKEDELKCNWNNSLYFTVGYDLILLTNSLNEVFIPPSTTLGFNLDPSTSTILILYPASKQTLLDNMSMPPLLPDISDPYQSKTRLILTIGIIGFRLLHQQIKQFLIHLLILHQHTTRRTLRTRRRTQITFARYKQIWNIMLL